ncbi:Anucleate primary sterigmata protein A [Serendipita indica DSM 11827]|nr:Anucleate primary sterigmata protein A [Serendipita indica DSM 11827]
MATVSRGRTNGAAYDDGNDMDSSSVGGQMRHKLQALLDEKERQLQQVEALSQRVLAQQMELEERINQIAELDEAGTGANTDEESEMRAQLDDLAQTMHGWATENETLWNGAVAKDTLADTPQFQADSQPASHGPSAAQSSRRAKNAAHRANDVEFAFEIGSGLLTEIRRLQSLLAERDKTLQDMKDERDDLERSIDSLRTALRTQEANAGIEENWNLEVSLQEMRTQLSNTQSSLERSESEQKRMQKQMTTLREASEGHKSESEKLANQLQDLRTKHETDVAQMRKQAATLQREKGELQTNVETLKAEVAKKAKTVARFGSPMTPNDARFLTPARGGDLEEEDGGEDVFGTAASTRRRMDSSLIFGEGGYDLDLDVYSPDVSPIKNPNINRLSPAIPNHTAAEIEALKQSLAHAHRQIGTLKSSLARERQLRTEYGRKLGAAGEEVAPEEPENEEDYEDEPGELPRVTPLRAGRGRGGRRVVGNRPGARTSLAAKLAAAAKAGQSQTLESQFTGHELPLADFSMEPEEWVDVDDDGMRRRSEDRESVAGSGENVRKSLDEDALGRKHKTQSIISIASSMDGMDPVYANVLKGARDSRVSSEMGRPSIDSTSAPVDKSRRGRKVQDESRPGSIFEAPGTLASELGGGLADASVVDDERLRAELGLGEEDIEEEIEEDDEDVFVSPRPKHVASTSIASTAAAPSVVAAPKVETQDMGIQCDLLLPPTPPPVVERASMSIQTDEEPAPPPPPVIERASMSIQTDEEPVPPPPPARFELSIQTDPIIVETQSVAVETDAVPVRQYADASSETIEPPTEPVVPRKVPIEHVGVAVGAAAAGAAGATVLATQEKRMSRPPPSAFKDPTDPLPSGRSSRFSTDGETEYEDARETIGATTPAQSMGDGDFHSINDFGGSDDDEDEDGQETETDSAESIRVTRMDFKRPGIGSHANTAQDVTIRDVAVGTDEEMEASDKRDTIKPEPIIKIVEVEKPKPEVKEVSIQTDEWKPTLPPGAQLFAVGPQSQQFQFVSGPNTPGVSSVALPTAAGVAAAAALKPALRDGGAQRSRVGTGASINSALTDPSRSRVPSGTLAAANVPKPVDRTRPPTMMLPPPPRLPPPPTTSPTLTSSAGSIKAGPSMGPPPRPMSPPPAELIQRATTPTIGRNSTLAVPASMGRTASNPSTRPPSAGSIPPASARQVRSAVNGVTSGGEEGHESFDDKNARGAKSMASLTSSRHSVSSRRPSITSSISSEHQGSGIRSVTEAPKSQALMAASGMGAMASRPTGEGATDPAIIHAITQTMIGEFLYKYTRKPIGKKYTERRHRRYFWIHPYTKTIYWSAEDPGSTNVHESSAKSAYIESVKSVMDPNPMPPGLHQYSVVVTTANREMKFTAPTKERHDIWFNALSYLIARPSANTPSQPSQSATRVALSPTSANQRQASQTNEEPRRMEYSPRSQKSGHSAVTIDTYNTPRAPRSVSRMSNPYGSVGKRSGTAAAEFMRWNSDAPASPSRMEDNTHAQDSEFQLHDDPEDAYDGLENVRACCDGKHDVGALGGRHHHHHHHHHQQQQQQQQQQRGTVRGAAGDSGPERPASPSGWSFRSGRRV